MKDSLDDLLDGLVAEYSDALAGGRNPAPPDFLARAPAEARPGLERCLKMIDAGLATVPARTRPLAPKAAFGRYELRRELGRGGMALVWLAHDRELQRPVALKILRPGLALEERHVDRFRREALAIAKLRHPNVVQIFDVGEVEGWHYLAMEFVEGPSLASVLEALADHPRRTADELARAAGIPALARREETFEQGLAALLVGVADGLQAAHELGLVHRDVKPSNVLLRRDGTPVVADFGLAKAEGDPALSMTGDTLGTPYYMSPEQAWLSETVVDHRTDVYSIGVTLYEALSGARPFEGASVLEVFEAIRTRIAPGLRSVAPNASRDAAALVRRAMAREAEKRYDSASELAEDLRRLANRTTTEARRAEGGPLRRTFVRARMILSGQPYEYRSRRKFLGLPLVHVITGRRYVGQPVRKAIGWIAMGDIAYGGLALGGAAVGGIVCGGFAAGLITFGGFSAGLFVACGGFALGTLAMGGISAGYVATGGIALGYAAIGGLVWAIYGQGGKVYARYAISEEHQDLTEEAWFEGAFPWLARLLGSDGG